MISRHSLIVLIIFISGVENHCLTHALTLNSLLFCTCGDAADALLL